MSFRNPEFIRRREFTSHELVTSLNDNVANNDRQKKTGYRFLIDNTSEANPIDWYNAYLEVNFKLVTLADSAVGITAGANNGNRDCTTTNGHTFIKRLSIVCNGLSIYSNTNANETSNVLSLLKYTKPYADNNGQNEFFYLDTSTGTTGGRPGQELKNEGFARRKILTDTANVNKFKIPLHSYGYFAGLENKLHPNTKMEINLELEDDDNIIFRKAAAPDSKVILTKLTLWCPNIIFNGKGMAKFKEEYLEPKKWSYLKENLQTISTTSNKSTFRINPGIKKPRHVFIWVVPSGSYNNQEHNIFTFKTFSIGANNRYFSKARLEVNDNRYYPELEYTSIQEERLYNALMEYNSAQNDFLTGSIINRANFRNLFGILYFDLRNQDEDIKNGAVSLNFKYELNGDNPTNFKINALVLHEEEIEMYTSSGKLMIRV